MKRLAAAMMMMFLSVGVSAQTAETLNGAVTDATGSAVRGAQVTLQRLARTLATTTDEGGRFRVEGVVPGDYLLTVAAAGFATFTREVRSPGARDLTIALEVAGLTDAITVQADVSTYLADTSTTGTKLALPRLDVPQSFSAIPEPVLEDRQIIRLTEAADNVAGVSPSIGVNGLSSAAFNYRGFRPSYGNGSLRNGFRDLNYLSARETANIERVEFLKGPASLLYGLSDAGGLVNTITKKPSAIRRTEAELQFGSFQLVRPVVSTTGSFDKAGTVLYRATFAAEAQDTWREFGKTRSVFVAPAVTWKMTPKTTVTAELELQRFRHFSDTGLPAEPEFLQVPRQRSYVEPFARSISKQVYALVNVTHAFNENWSVRSGYNGIANQSDNPTIAYDFFGFLDGRSTLPRTYYFIDQSTSNLTTQNELYGRFSTGRIKHRIVAGFELARNSFEFLFNNGPLSSIDRDTPVHGVEEPTSLVPLFGERNGTKWLGLYALDQIELHPRLKLLVGLRSGFVTSTYVDTLLGETLNSQSLQNTAPRIGLTFNVTRSSAVYTSYATSFFPVVTATSRTGHQFAPERGKQIEVGFKQEFFNNRLLATVALYRIRKQQVLTLDPIDPIYSVQTGEQANNGIEVEVSGRPTPYLNTIATYANQDAFVSRDNRLLVGQPLIGVPRHSGGVFLTYDFSERLLDGLSGGIGIYAYGDRLTRLYTPAQLAARRAFYVPSYSRADVNLAYRRESWRVNLAVKNLLDADIYEPGGLNAIYPQAGRNAVASVGYTF